MGGLFRCSLGGPLLNLDACIDFAALAQAVDAVAPRPAQPKGGHPPYPTATMLRLLVLKRLHNLSDEQLKFQLLGNICTTRPNSNPHLIQLYKPDQMQKLIELTLKSRFQCVFWRIFRPFLAS